MNEKIHKIIMFISVCLASFCAAAIVAVIIVDNKASQINFKPSKPHYNGVSFSENTPYDTEEQETSRENKKDDVSDTPTEEASTYNIEITNGAEVENIMIKEKKKTIPSPKDVIKSIPLGEKTKILRKYLPKMSAQDIKYFTSLLKEKKPDFNKAKKRLFEVYSPEEITELYKIYKSYEEKIHESNS